MPRTFKLLTQNERDEIIANTLKAQERDLFTYELNIERYTEMVADPEIDPDLKIRLEELLVTEEREKNKTETAYNATVAQAPTQTKLEEAIARIEAKELAKGQ